MIFCLLVSVRVYIFTRRLQKLFENMQICLRGSVILLIAVKVDWIHLYISCFKTVILVSLSK